VALDRARISKECIETYEGRHRGKEREQRIERDTGRDRQEAIVAELLIKPPQDIPPASCRNFTWL